MDELSRLQRETSDLTNILSLITKTASNLAERDHEPRVSEQTRPEDDQIDPGTENEHIDEAEFEDPITATDAEVDDIKRKTLDRLAEVLARSKTAKGTQVRQKRNADAKHVTSVIMIDQLEHKSITFILSKNEGFDTIDKNFLRELEDLLQSIASNGTRNFLFVLLS